MKRGIAGTMVFTVFDRDALIEAVKTNVTRIGSNPASTRKNTAYDPMTIDQWDEIMTGRVEGVAAADRANNITQNNVAPLYADELPPLTSSGFAS